MPIKTQGIALIKIEYQIIRSFLSFQCLDGQKYLAAFNAIILYITSMKREGNPNDSWHNTGQAIDTADDLLASNER